MTKEEIQDILEELHLVRPEILQPKAKKLFEAIMIIANERDELQQRIDKAIEYIEENKNKTYAPYGDNEDYDYEVCLDEDEIKYLLKLLRGDNND